MSKKYINWLLGTIATLAIGVMLTQLFSPLSSQLTFLSKPGCLIQNKLSDKKHGIDIANSHELLKNNKINREKSTTYESELSALRKKLDTIDHDLRMTKESYDIALRVCDNQELLNPEELTSIEDRLDQLKCPEDILDDTIPRNWNINDLYVCADLAEQVLEHQKGIECRDNPPRLNSFSLDKQPDINASGFAYSALMTINRSIVSSIEEAEWKLELAQKSIKEGEEYAKARLAARRSMPKSCDRYLVSG